MLTQDATLPEKTHIENEGHVIKIELVLLLVVFLELSSVVILALLCYVCFYVSLLFCLKHTNENTGKKVTLLLFCIT